MTNQNTTGDLKQRLDKIHDLTARCIGAACVFVVLGFVAGIWVFFVFRKQLSTLNDFGAFGSYLQGAVASLWSLAGLLFIFAAFLAQKQQIIQQDAELEDQKKQFALQHQSLKRQNFESAFFELLSFQNQITEQLRRVVKWSLGMAERTDVTEGRLCFSAWYKTLQGGFEAMAKSEEDKKNRDFVVNVYCDFYHDYQASLGHYFRTLYHVFKFVKESDIDTRQKRRYTSLVRAQLSTGELVFLFYNCLSPFGEKFKPLVEEFGLLEHLDKDFLLNPTHADFYETGAYH